MNERDWQSFVDEADSVKQAMLLARVSNDASEKADRQNKRLWIALAGSIIGNVILAIVMVCSLIYMQAHAQEMLNKGLENALQAIAEIQIEGTAVCDDCDRGRSCFRNCAYRSSRGLQSVQHHYSCCNCHCG